MIVNQQGVLLLGKQEYYLKLIYISKEIVYWVYMRA